jgi:galactose mutarotase-like enzyme
VTPQPPPPRLPTGEQWEIAHGRQRAIVTEVGATLRSYTVEGEPVIDGFGPEEWAHGGRGQVLAPWPNRLGDGRYRFSEHDVQAALDEPEHNNAIHGLVRWLPWQLEVKAQNLVAVRCFVFPVPGYPFHLELRLEYRLGRDGLTITATALNVGAVTLPFGIGEVRAVEGTEYDFTKSRPIGATQLDTAYTGIERGRDRLAWAVLSDGSGEPLTRLWSDEGFPYLMCYTGDTLPAPERRRAVAVEPMTCPPDGLRSGRGLIILEPGEHWEGAWGIVPR